MKSVNVLRFIMTSRKLKKGNNLEMSKMLRAISTICLGLTRLQFSYNAINASKLVFGDKNECCHQTFSTINCISKRDTQNGSVEFDRVFYR